MGQSCDSDDDRKITEVKDEEVKVGKKYTILDMDDKGVKWELGENCDTSSDEDSDDVAALIGAFQQAIKLNPPRGAQTSQAPSGDEKIDNKNVKGHEGSKSISQTDEESQLSPEGVEQLKTMNDKLSQRSLLEDPILACSPEPNLFQFLKEGKLEGYYDVFKEKGWSLGDLELVDSDEKIPEGVKSKVHRKKMLKYILDWKEKKKKKEVEEKEKGKWIKIAFVVGVSNYSKFKDPLKGSKVDAEDVRKALKKNGFYVFSAMDMDGGDEEDCLEDDLLDSFDEFVLFRKKYWEKAKSDLKDRLFTLFYFAGHGLFTGTSQCLIPGDFDEKKMLRKALKITKESKDTVILKAQKKILQNTLLVTTVINALSDEGKLVLLLDCCRNDVKFSFELEPKKKRSGSGKGKSTDIIVSYSTKIGDKAKDLSIRGRNSPYTRALLKNFEKGKGEKIEDILKAVREDVLVETEDNQEPVFEDKQLKNSVFTW